MTRLGIDIDGVIADFVSGFRNTVNRLWPNRLPRCADVQCWSLESWTSPNQKEWRLSKSEIDFAWAAVKETPNFWLTLPSYQENVVALRKFLTSESEVEVFYVTSRIATVGLPVAHQSHMWLETHGLLRPGTAVIVKPSGVEKREIYHALRIASSVDDYLETVQQTCEGHQAHLLDRPYNQVGREADTIVVPNLESYLAHVKS